jgi:hypothetical protein
VLIPFCSEFDPERQSKGRIDPLGLAAQINRLADRNNLADGERRQRPQLSATNRGPEDENNDLSLWTSS